MAGRTRSVEALGSGGSVAAHSCCCMRPNRRGGRSAAGRREARSVGEKTRYACAPDFVIPALAPAELSACRYRQEPALWIADRGMPFVTHHHGYLLEQNAIICRVPSPMLAVSDGITADSNRGACIRQQCYWLQPRETHSSQQHDRLEAQTGHRLTARDHRGRCCELAPVCFVVTMTGHRKAANLFRTPVQMQRI